MAIQFNKENNIFKLDTYSSTYIFGIFEGNYLVHYYYGAPIPDTNVDELWKRPWFASFCPDSPSAQVPNFSPAPNVEYSIGVTSGEKFFSLAVGESGQKEA